MQFLAHLNLVSFKYNCFTIAGPNCNLRNLGEETYEKKSVYQAKETCVVHVKLRHQLWEYRQSKQNKKQKKTPATKPNQTKPKKQFVYILLSRENIKVCGHLSSKYK